MATTPSEEKWETCRIEVADQAKQKWFQGWFTIFSVEAVGPTGAYTIATAEYNATDNGSVWGRPRIAVKIVDDLVSKLLQDGWEHTGVGSQWYQHTFRRRVAPKETSQSHVEEGKPESINLDNVIEETRKLLSTQGVDAAIHFYHTKTGVPLNAAKTVVKKIRKGKL